MSQATSSNDRATNANLHSITLMIAAMGCFTIADLLIKIASQTMPVGQAMLVLGLGSTVVFLILMRMKKEPVQLTPLAQPAMLLRSSGDFLGSTSMCLALAYVPISTIGAVIQAVPLMLTAAGALFLGERVGIRRLSAIFVGFVGVMFILQPGRTDFDAMVMLALLAAVGLTIRDIGTKLVSHKVSTLLVSFYGSMIFAISGAILLSITGGAVWPGGTMIVMFLAMIALGSVGYVCVTNAVRIGEMSVVSPFRYSRLLFSVAAGVIIFGEKLDAMMLFGCALTMGAGLYIWRREILLKPATGLGGAEQTRP